MRRYIQIGLLLISNLIPIDLPAAIDLTTSMKAFDAKPGDLISVSFKIANKESLSLALIDTTIAPQGWHIVSPEPEFQVKPLRSATRLIALKVPALCPKGSYFLLYKVSEKSGQGLSMTDTIEVHVSGLANFSLKVENSPSMIVAGEPFELLASIENRGNTKLSVVLTTTCESKCEVLDGIGEIPLEIGEKKSLVIGCLSRSDIKRKSSTVLRIDALAITDDGDSIAATRTVRVDLIPQNVKTANSYVRLPSVFRMTNVADKRGMGYQIEVIGSGTPWEGRNLSLNLRSPDIENIGRYTSRDLIYFRYSEKKREIHIGDKGYSLSPLLERYNYGRGIEIRQEWKGLSFHTFFVRRRWESPSTNEGALAVGVKLSESARLGFNALSRRKGADSTRTWLYSLKSDLDLPYKGSASIEVAIDADQAKITKESSAQRIDLRGQLPGSVRYSGEWIRANPKFKGYYKDAQYGIFNLNIPFLGKLSNRFSLRTYDSNLKSDQTKEYGIRERDVQFATTYQPKRGTRFSVELERFSRLDPLPKNGFDFVEKSVEISAGFTSKHAGFNASGEFGRHNDRNLSSSRGIARYAFNFQLNQSTLSMWGLSFRTGDRYYSLERNRHRDFGISNSLRIRRNINATIRYLCNKNLLPQESTTHNLQATLNLSLGQRHEILIRGMLSNGSNNGFNEPSLLIQYSLKAPIPIARNRSIGSVEGRVLRSDTNPPEPIPRALLQLGDEYTVTDPKGMFKFEGIKPGFHHLYLDPASAGEEMTCTKPMPLGIKVEGGKTTRSDLHIVRRGRIEVSLQTDSLKLQAKPLLLEVSSSAFFETGAKSDLIKIPILITSEGEVYRETFNREAYRISKNLRPGLWKIKPILPKNLSRLLRIEPEELTIDLKPGSEEQILFTLKEKRRPLMIIDSGEIRIKTDKAIKQ
ncbi:MAG: COG1470 family protein [bacterium]